MTVDRGWTCGRMLLQGRASEDPRGKEAKKLRGSYWRLVLLLSVFVQSHRAFAKWSILMELQGSPLVHQHSSFKRELMMERCLLVFQGPRCREASELKHLFIYVLYVFDRTS